MIEHGEWRNKINFFFYAAAKRRIENITVDRIPRCRATRAGDSRRDIINLWFTSIHTIR